MEEETLLTIPPRAISPLTDGQEMAMSVAGVLSGTLSVLGSATIVYKVVRNIRKAAPYDRLMLGLSSCDMVASLTYAMAPFLLPDGTSQRVWASGNDATCTVLGFFTQFSFSAIAYNGMLSIYYLLTVRYGVKRQVFARRYEFIMHFSIWTFFVVTSSVGAGMGFYSEQELAQGCWVKEYPSGCEDVGNCKSVWIAWIYGGFPTLFTLFSLIISNLMVFFHVRRTFGRNNIMQSPSPPQNQKQALEPTLSENHQQQQQQQQQQLQQQQESEIGFRQRTHIQEVATQGFLYVATFFLSYSAGIVLRILESMDFHAADEGTLYWLMIIDACFRPLQGFFNMFVYNRPNYNRVRAAYPELSKWDAIQIACLDSQIPRWTEISRYPSSTTGTKTKNNSKYRKSGSGSAFSSNLDVVKEASHESSSFHASDDGFETKGSLTDELCDSYHKDDDIPVIEMEPGTGMPDTHSIPQTQETKGRDGLSQSSSDDDDSMELDLEESLQVFRGAASNLKRIGMDGSVSSLENNHASAAAVREYLSNSVSKDLGNDS